MDVKYEKTVGSQSVESRPNCQLTKRTQKNLMASLAKGCALGCLCLNEDISLGLPMSDGVTTGSASLFATSQDVLKEVGEHRNCCKVANGGERSPLEETGKECPGESARDEVRGLSPGMPDCSFIFCIFAMK